MTTNPETTVIRRDAWAISQRIARLNARRVYGILHELVVAERNQEISDFVTAKMNEDLPGGTRIGYAAAIEEASEVFGISYRQVYRIHYGH